VWSCGYIALFLCVCAGSARFTDFKKAIHKTEEFKKINPRGQIPAMIDQRNGACLYESAAICMYLQAQFATKERSLLPTSAPEFAQCLVRIQESHTLQHTMSAIRPVVAQIRQNLPVNPQLLTTAQTKMKHEVGIWEDYLRAQAEKYHPELATAIKNGNANETKTSMPPPSTVPAPSSSAAKPMDVDNEESKAPNASRKRKSAEPSSPAGKTSNGDAERKAATKSSSPGKRSKLNNGSKKQCTKQGTCLMPPTIGCLPPSIPSKSTSSGPLEDTPLFFVADRLTVADLVVSPILIVLKRFGYQYRGMPFLTHYLRVISRRPSFQHTWPPHWKGTADRTWIKAL